ncbi:hypothetical protein [Spirosoma endophyticum]|uniref:Uncharacterized protein n=1 Tax=Spirosoma endophyticum TaxID=662367 RepID=A0A1I1LVQ0_9BACT|nr:hypothetical protein [Spirosoma endophyticum]SFC77055.1 hypothetical protein SAMN05216167_102362 [Spirosoma endophyticum]
MADKDEDTRKEDQQDLEHQQQDLFQELAREQTDAEKAQKGDQERSAKAPPQDEKAE